MGVVAFVLWVYAGLGLAVAAAFLVIGFDRVDPAAQGAYAVRPLLVPGLVLLWPLVLWRWRVLARANPAGGGAR
jgi:hypothetical protein